MEPIAHLHGMEKLSLEARAALSQIVSIRAYERHQIIQQPGSRCQTIYVVQTGMARIFYQKDDKDITEHFAFSGDLIVRAESLFTGQPTRKGIEALDHTTLLIMDAPRLFQLYDRYHDIERMFRQIFEAELVRTIKRLESLQFMSATERYQELLQNTDLVQKIPLKYIASYLGITQVSLSRIRAGLK